MNINFKANENASVTNIDFVRSPNILISGGVRSGKTTTLKALLDVLHKAHPKSEFYFGTNCKPELQKFLDVHSNSHVTEPANGADSISDLHNKVLSTLKGLLSPIIKEKERRSKLFNDLCKKTGKDYPSSFEEYNKMALEVGEPLLDRLFLVIDDLDLFMQNLPCEIEELSGVKGSPVHSLFLLLRSGGVLGINVVVVVSGLELPMVAMSNLTTRIPHNPSRSIHLCT